MKRKSFVLLVIWLAGINQLLAQAPSISSFSPDSGPIGTEVTIQGSNFDATPANNTVYFGGAKASVLTATASELVVEVPVGSGNQPISVLVNGLAAFSASPFKVTFESDGAITSGSFGSGITLTPGDYPVTSIHADFDGDGLVDIATANEDGLSYSVFRNTSSGLGDISFSADAGANLGINPKDMAYADFNGDGKLDIVTGNSNLFGTINYIQTLKNTSSVGSISFDTQLSFMTDSDPVSIAVGDLDGDGKSDVVAVDGTNSQVSIFENTTNPLASSITFAAHVDFNVGANPVSVAIADIDGDGLLDIITASADDRSVSVLRNTTTGATLSFEPKVDFPVNSSTPTYVLRVGDLDNDGLPDLVTKNSRHLSILRNTSTVANVSMATAQDILFDTGYAFPGLGDLNGDGKLDAILNDGSNDLEILANTSTSGAISFGGSVSVTIGAPVDYTMFFTSVTDMDGDGEPEIIAPGEIGAFFGGPTPVLYVVRNLGSGTDFLTFSIPEQINPAVIDYDNHTIDIEVSGIPDLTSLVATFTTSFRALPNVDGINPDSGITALDYTNPVTFTVYAEDGSGIQDWTVTVTLGCIEDVVSETVEACGSYEFDSQVLTNSGTYTSTFQNAIGCDSTVTLNLTITPTHFYEDVYATESYTFDGSSLTESGQYEYGPFTSSTGCDSTYVLNLTIEPDTYDTQSFLQFQSVETPFPALSGATFLGDIDGDEDIDAIIIGSNYGNSAKKTTIFLNQEDGDFVEDEEHGITNVFTWHQACKLVDIDGDGDLDFMLNGFDNNTGDDNAISELYINDGSGNFQLKADAGLPVLEQVAFDVADVDGDNDLDMIISGGETEGAGEETKLWLNDGSGVFTEAVGVEFTSSYSGTVDFGDVDNDGDQDVFITGDTEITVGASNVAVLYLNDGTGNFEESTNQPFAGIAWSDVEMLDLDGDDDLDFFASSDGGGQQGYSVVYRNDGYGNFRQDTGSEIPEVRNGDIDFIDFDGDGDLDFVQAGTILDEEITSLVDAAFIYVNNGFGHFTPLEICSLVEYSLASISIGDVDKDGRPDILIAGTTETENSVNLYLNKEISNDVSVEACGSYEFDGSTLTESGNYQGVFTDEYGCTYPVNLDLTIVEGDDVETTLDHCGAYEFGTQLLTESGIYTETFMNQAGCDSTVTLTFGYLQEPVVEIVQNGVFLSAISDSTVEYDWYDCDSGELFTSIDLSSIIPFTSGNYSVEVINSAGCVTRSECIFFDWILANSERINEETSIYPTVTNGSFTLDLNREVKDLNIRILTMDGRTVYNNQFDTFSKSELTVNGTAGLYLVQVSKEGQVLTTKRIFKR